MVHVEQGSTQDKHLLVDRSAYIPVLQEVKH